MGKKTVALFSALVSCSSPQQLKQQARWMDETEARIQMPGGSAALESYARYYALDDGERVVGVYITIVEPENPQYNVPIGERRWVNRRTELPVILDGGCTVVTVRFDPKTGNAGASCNGVA